MFPPGYASSNLPNPVSGYKADIMETDGEAKISQDGRAGEIFVTSAREGRGLSELAA